jgi:hypothetical protein
VYILRNEDSAINCIRNTGYAGRPERMKNKKQTIMTSSKEEPVRKYWAHHSPSRPTIAAQLLGEPATGEPYTILIMNDQFQGIDKCV